MNEELKSLLVAKLGEIPAYKGRLIDIRRADIKYSGLYVIFSVEGSHQQYTRLFTWSKLSNITGY